LNIFYTNLGFVWNKILCSKFSLTHSNIGDILKYDLALAWV